MEKEASAPNATILDTTEKIALSIDALTVISCNQDMMKTNASTTQNTPVQTLLNKNCHLHPPSESPHQKPLRSRASLPIDRTVTPPHPQMELEKGGKRERNPSGKDSKTMSTEVYPDNSGKWTKSTTKSSKIFPSPLTTKSNTMTPPMRTSMANQVTLMTFDFQWNFKCSKGVMLRFSFLCTISQHPYLLLRSLRNTPITTDF